MNSTNNPSNNTNNQNFPNNGSKTNQHQPGVSQSQNSDLLSARAMQQEVQQSEFKEENIRKALFDDQSDKIANELNDISARLQFKLDNLSKNQELAESLAEAFVVVSKERPNKAHNVLGEVLKENM